MKRPIYFDYNATTPVDPQVFEAMLPYFQNEFGNSVSASHAFGWNAERAVEAARTQVAKLLNCTPHEVHFTSGATEANNWALRGLVDHIRLENPQAPIEIISSPLEHSSVTQTLRRLEKMAVTVHWLKPNSKGELSLQELESRISPHTKLISLMWINNEIGNINPIQEISKIARQHKVYLHSDATQALGKIKVDLSQTPVDLLSFSAHKIYGPKGVGALCIRGHDPKVRIEPLLFGGGHERGQRSGTLNVPAIVGMGKACEILSANLDSESAKLTKLRDQLWVLLKKNFPTARLNGPEIQNRAPNNLNVTFENCTVPPTFAEVAVSRGSACQSGAMSTSPILKSIGLSDQQAESTLRLSVGRFSTVEELEKAVQLLVLSIKGKNTDISVI